jgi:hypothetical protein
MQGWEKELKSKEEKSAQLEFNRGKMCSILLGSPNNST